MKESIKIIAFFLLITLLIPINAFAAKERTGDIIYLQNGSYITVEITSTGERATSTKTASKTYVCHDSSDNEEWRATLTGTFTYTGTTSACTASSCNVTITDSDWYVVSKTASKSGSSALADLTMGRKFLGITIEKETINMTLTCDANGNLS